MDALTAPQFHKLQPEQQAHYLLKLREMGAEGHRQHLIEVMTRRGVWSYRDMEANLKKCLAQHRVEDSLAHQLGYLSVAVDTLLESQL